jgi:antitoxin (DNA-binding transcriptional repressor) of toxin-antitoxin stability system
MKSVNIAKFKAELSKYLGFVRRGEELIVMDRKESVARVIPFNESAGQDLIVDDASDDCLQLFAIQAKPLHGGLDSLRFLQEERGER